VALQDRDTRADSVRRVVAAIRDREVHQAVRPDSIQPDAVPCIPHAARQAAALQGRAQEWERVRDSVLAPALAVHAPEWVELREWCRLRARRRARSVQALREAADASSIRRAKKAR
jgi:hypothetical protein